MEINRLPQEEDHSECLAQKSLDNTTLVTNNMSDKNKNEDVYIYSEKSAENFEQNNFLHKQGFKFFHLNIHYLYPKFDELKILLHNHTYFDIIGLCETFLNDSFCDSEFQISGYQMFRKDRKTNGGGIIVFVNQNFKCVRRFDLESDKTEAIWLEVQKNKQKPFVFGYIYRPPSSNVEWNCELEYTIEKIFNENKEIILTGDFNYNYDPITKATNNNSWDNITNSFNLKQLVDMPTRVTCTTKTIIDHLYTNFSQNISEINVPAISISDHFPVCFTRKVSSTVPKGPLHHMIQYRNMKHFDESVFLESLEQQPWSILDIYEDPNDALDTFNSLFNDVLNRHAPFKQKRVKHVHLPDWYNPEILQATKERDKAKKLNDRAQYKFWRNKVKSLIYNSKKRYYSETINDNKKHAKELWKNLKQLSGKVTNHQTNYIQDEEGTQISDPIKTAEVFNNYFIDIFKSAPQNCSSLSESDKIKLQEFIAIHTKLDSPFSIPKVTSTFIEKELQKLDLSKSTGLDGIGPKFLKISAQIISKPLEKIFNLSISKGIFPAIFKRAKVTPMYKKGSKCDKTNYRPISILPILSKVLERHVSNTFKSFLENNSLLHPNQSGFRTSYSCETALTTIIDNWIKAINEENLVGTIFLDLTKAFDLINHKLLIEKLKLYNVDENAITWFWSYLTNRSQQVHVSGKYSSAQDILSEKGYEEEFTQILPNSYLYYKDHMKTTVYAV
ncbi:uncharacterized protein LOC128556711 [Mercenaria mercenaria]|uniref:uncharacterized protein LOC128556711 n=1 Tax=Mercenaria mercenaria TaxID=6596 RepID=UPI00234E825C|nr:uncharacterized protein LOC128556711 [Mercenaria mercenaria]